MTETTCEQNTILLLTKLEYCHVIDNNTGIVRLVEGPYRGSLGSNESLYGAVQSKLIVKEGQYAIILNPYDDSIDDVRHGDREVRIGPTLFSLHPGEKLEGNKINDEFVLEKDMGILMKALRDFDDGGVQRHAGDLWIVEGPARFIPHKYALLEEHVEAISLGLEEGIYIKNVRTGEIRLEIGPKAIMLSPEEELHEKEYSERELEALHLDEYDFDATRAIPLRLLKAEAAFILSNVDDEPRVEIGPKLILLKPHERPYIMKISGSTPKVPGAMKIWYVKLGPVFSTDELSIRTKDNAVLRVRLRYKWRFKMEPAQPEKIFAVEDFIGFATETMAGLIREEAAKYNFEEFHSGAARIIKNVVFGSGCAAADINGEESNPGDAASYVFEENGFEIFGIDVKYIVPEDPEIAAQLNAAIKSNMDVYVQKIQQTAQLEAEQQLVEGRIGIEKAKVELIELEQANLKARELGNAKIAAEAEIERARGDAEAIAIRKTAENEADAKGMELIINRLKEDGDQSYIDLQRVLSFANVDKTVIVPTDSKLFVPIGPQSIGKEIIDDM